jgi:hypothetical protein
MFTNPLPDDEDYRIFFAPFAERHHIKRFAKDYRGKRWLITLDSIFQDLKRVHSMQQTQQVDELKHGDDCKLFKYDFTIAQSGVSPKASGNRCVVFLDVARHRQDVLIVYGKTDLPKNTGETQFIYKTVEEQFKELWERLGK